MNGRKEAGVPQVLSIEHVLQVDSDSDSDRMDNGVSSMPSDRISIGKHCVLQHLRSNVKKLDETLQTGHKSRSPIHEILYVDEFRRSHAYPLPIIMRLSGQMAKLASQFRVLMYFSRQSPRASLGLNIFAQWLRFARKR